MAALPPKTIEYLRQDAQEYLIAGALDVAARRWPTFPCRSDKKPATAHGFKDASLEPHVIRSMFSHPDAALIAISTGEASGVVVLDFDQHRDEADAAPWFSANEHRFPPTRWHQTMSGGLHMLFKAPHGIKIGNSAGKLAHGVDVRGDGGYVIVPPSFGYSVMDGAELAELPGWLIEACLAPKAEMAPPPVSPAPQPVASHGVRDADAVWGEVALRAEADELRRTRDGGRNHALNKAAFRLGQLVPRYLDRGAVEAALRQATHDNGLYNDPTSGGPRAAEASLNSGVTAGMAEPRYREERNADETRRNAGFSADPEQPATDPDELLNWLCAHSWAALDIPPEPRLLGDLITSTSRVFLVGSTGLGKTQVAHGMAVGIASGAGFVHWKAERPARVLLIDGEMSVALIKDRIGSALQRTHSAVAARNLAVYALDRSEEFASRFPGVGMFEPLNTEKGQDFLLRLIDLVRPEVIILDNVMSLISGDQKDEVPWSETLPLVAKISSLRIGQVWLDHTGHDRSRQYGSATKAWRFDAVGIMSSVEGADDGTVAFQLSFDSPGKARRRTPANWQDFAPRLVMLTGDEWSSQPAGKNVTPGGVQRVKPSAEKWYDALLDALVVSSIPGQATEGEWLAEGIRLGLTEPVADDDTRTVKEAKRTKFRTAKAALVTARWIGINGDTVSDLINGTKPKGT